MPPPAFYRIVPAGAPQFDTAFALCACVTRWTYRLPRPAVAYLTAAYHHLQPVCLHTYAHTHGYTFDFARLRIFPVRLADLLPYTPPRPIPARCTRTFYRDTPGRYSLRLAHGAVLPPTLFGWTVRVLRCDAAALDIATASSTATRSLPIHRYYHCCRCLHCAPRGAGLAAQHCPTTGVPALVTTGFVPT